jgi:riboflavin biosynthesis RibT protein
MVKALKDMYPDYELKANAFTASFLDKCEL